MAGSVYNINRGIGRSIEFRGLKAQYIWWLAAALVMILILFALMYLSGINSWFCVAFAMGASAGAFALVYRLSRVYGEHGLKKRWERRRLPDAVSLRSRRVFFADSGAGG